MASSRNGPSSAQDRMGFDCRGSTKESRLAAPHWRNPSGSRWLSAGDESHRSLEAKCPGTRPLATNPTLQRVLSAARPVRIASPISAILCDRRSSSTIGVIRSYCRRQPRGWRSGSNQHVHHQSKSSFTNQLQLIYKWPRESHRTKKIEIFLNKYVNK